MPQTVPVLVTYASDLAHRETALETKVTIKIYLMPYTTVIAIWGSQQQLGSSWLWLWRGTLPELPTSLALAGIKSLNRK